MEPLIFQQLEIDHYVGELRSEARWVGGGAGSAALALWEEMDTRAPPRALSRGDRWGPGGGCPGGGGVF